MMLSLRVEQGDETSFKTLRSCPEAGDCFARNDDCPAGEFMVMFWNEIKSWRRDIAFGVLAIVVVLAALIAGQIATFPNLAPWYASLNKPSFTPPPWVFAEVWSTLYALMAYGVWRILRLREDSSERRTALILFFAQLALNAAWSWMFFAAHSPLLGLVNIIPQLAVILLTVNAFWKLNKIAAMCLAPLAVWVAFAAVLNFSIWRLNG
ncbi:MAG: TspO/MBR family protein [Burkholderiaceae bacterium]